MPVRQTIKRHYKIISLLKLRPMSYEEVQNEISTDPDSIEEKLLTSQRTFQRDILDIASIYGIEIESNRSNGKYYIKDDIEDNHSQRLRENFEILDAIRLSKSLGTSLIFEKRKPLGTHYMAGLIHAIQNKFHVEFSYRKFSDNSESQRRVKPIALKEARNRWYLIGQEEDIIKNFALDRINELIIHKQKFKPISYNIEKEFKDSFGVINGTDDKTTKVILSFTPEQGKYVESLPLHHSQSLISESKEEICFGYYIRPTFDFKMEILSYGNNVKVIEPKEFQNEIARSLRSALEQY